MFFGVWLRCLLSFFVRFSLLRVAFWKRFSGANFCFWVVGVGLVFFWWVFVLCFCFIFWRFAPGSVWKNSLDVRSGCFLGSFPLPLIFFVVVVVFGFCLLFLSRDTDQVVTGHPRTRTCFAGSFSFLCPAAFVCFARFGRASCFLVVFRGAILGPARFWDSP